MTAIGNLALNLYERIFGWKTDRKLLVFESDDWGSLYLPNSRQIGKLEKEGILNPDREGYQRYDCLESRNDMEMLFDLLNQFTDINRNPAKFTFNTVLGNPDFEKIKESEFQNYFHQHFFDSYPYYNDEDCRDLWQSGIASQLFIPQFHAREHLNVRLWMDDLIQHRSDTKIAFDNSFYSLTRSKVPPRSYMAAYWQFSNSHLQEIQDITQDGLRMFNKTFGIPSSSFVACQFILPSEIEKITSEQGVRLIQSQRRYRSPTVRNRNKKKSRISGSQNSYGQYYSVRNVFFEPFEAPEQDWASRAFEQTKRAFGGNRPAIVSTHRVNYVGRCGLQARNSRLKQLDSYLRRLTQMYSDIEFISSDQLLDIMIGNEQGRADIKPPPNLAK